MLVVLIVPNVLRLFPFLVGADSSYVVMGGSMEPTLRVGDLTFTENIEPIEIEVNDIIAVNGDSIVFTHRVMEKIHSDEGILFKLKGDANEEPDASYVKGSEILGRTIFSVPMGYVFSQNGYVLLISIPLMILGCYQGIKIYKLYSKNGKSLKIRKRQKNSVIDSFSILLLLILIAGCSNMVAPQFTSVTGSYFIDTEISSKTVAGAGTWMVPSSISCLVTPAKIVAGESVMISGKINPDNSVEVAVKISDDAGSSWTTLTLITSGSDGAFNYEWIPLAGSYNITSSWIGDSDYYGATSNIVNLIVSESNEI